MTELQNKLLQIQNNLRCPKNQYNSFGGYSYRNAEDILEAVKPLCFEHGCLLIVTDEIIEVCGKNYVRATAKLICGDDCISVSASAREPQTQKGMNDSQLTGSCSSYARKYALNGLFCIDDTKDADNDNMQHEKVNTVYKEYKTKIEQCVTLEELEKLVPELTQIKTKISDREMTSLSQIYKMKKNEVAK